MTYMAEKNLGDHERKYVGADMPPELADAWAEFARAHGHQMRVVLMAAIRAFMALPADVRTPFIQLAQRKDPDEEKEDLAEWVAEVWHTGLGHIPPKLVKQYAEMLRSLGLDVLRRQGQLPPRGRAGKQSGQR